MKNLHSQTLTDLSARFIVPSGNYKGLLFIFDGDTQASQNFTAGLMGNITVNVDGRQKSAVDLDKLAVLNSYDFGCIEATNVEGAGFRFNAFLPLVDYADDSGYHLSPDKKMEILASFTGATATIVETGNFKCFGITCDNTLIQTYELRYNNHHLTIGAAGTFPFRIFQDNVRRLLIEQDSNLTSLSVKKDGVTIFDMTDKDDLNSLTNLFNNIETFSATLSDIVIDCSGSDDEVAAQNDDIELLITAGAACTVNVIVESMDITPNKSAKSVTASENALREKINRKYGKGVEVIAESMEEELID